MPLQAVVIAPTIAVFCVFNVAVALADARQSVIGNGCPGAAQPSARSRTTFA
jgi:hypothetical protein